MPAWVCHSCGNIESISDHGQAPCELCGAPMAYDPFKQSPRAPAETSDEFPLLDVPLHVVNDTVVIRSWELIDSGVINRLQPGSIYRVEVPGQGSYHIEIIEYSYSQRLYVVREFKVTAPDHVPKEWIKPKHRTRKKKET